MKRRTGQRRQRHAPTRQARRHVRRLIAVVCDLTATPRPRRLTFQRRVTPLMRVRDAVFMTLMTPLAPYVAGAKIGNKNGKFPRHWKFAVKFDISLETRILTRYNNLNRHKNRP